MGLKSIQSGARRINKARRGSLDGLLGNSGHQDTAIGRMRVRTYSINGLGDRIKHLRAIVQEGKRDPVVYAFARSAISKKCGRDWCVPEKDNAAEMRALFAALRKQVRYTSDIAGVDSYQKARNTLKLRTGDCIPEGSLLLRSDGVMVTIEDVSEGDVIFDGNGWAKVTKWWDKGVQDVRAISLNNGGVFVSTGGHRMFRVPRKGSACDAEEVLAEDLSLGDDLLQPREMAFSETCDLNLDLAFLLGVYLAEGSVRRRRVDGTIACVAFAGVPEGKGFRERVAEVGNRLGFSVTEAGREVYLTDGGDTLHKLINGRGTKALAKNLPHVQWSQDTAEAILSGLNADGGVATNGTTFVFSTISPTLAVQYRLLHRILGRSCSVKKVDEHGGLGSNPVYRVTVRANNRRRPWARIRSIADAGQAHVYDIETDSSRFYLPLQDIVVHNCDEYLRTLSCYYIS